ncbi:DoxX family protein [Bacillus sp. PS06]|uniref:DoxX family protein n=1 Tax=Bacillus sp. PS06 TaxID=2764176 RepID=UPI00178289D4|nr:DoxX family protein [Bacillus sp. PS06]MBD8067779.1 DoxX family protein [Bacillus sp. PS06]
MFVKFLRESKVAAGILLVIRLYLGYKWLTSGWGKVTGGTFDAGGFLHGAIANSTGENPTVHAWWASFLEGVAIPNAGLFTYLVMWGEVLVGIALILGIFTTFAALMGIIMNFAFLFSGTLSVNPQMVLLTIFVLVGGYNAGRFGLDRFVMPYLNKSRYRENDPVGQQ